ncbi:MAG: LacI family DNA-binding transcriptional regulator [Lachnospiraceae bacterium]|nr:LacI family DNA-binding transcriptional regulator [Lachnospiraceae bacterium]
MEEHRVRISDIAEELGLSSATVSNVLHGKTKKVSDETIKRVQALLEERQYIPSMAGVLLAQNSSKIIGVVINDHEKYENHTLEDVFIASSLNHLSTEIEREGLFMMVKKIKDIEDIIKFASMWNMDGLVVIGFCDQDYMYLRSHMRIPFVVYDGYCENPEGIFNITIDNFDGGYQVGQYFKANGHKRALCIADNDICVDKERYEGFCAAFGKENTEFCIIPMKKKERWRFYEEQLPLFREVTAVFAVSDYYAIDLIHFLKENHFLIPEELSVAGFDDIPMCEQVTPTLTSVRQDGAMRAKLAIEKLREMKQRKNTCSSIRLPVTLVERASTK